MAADTGMRMMLRVRTSLGGSDEWGPLREEEEVEEEELKGDLKNDFEEGGDDNVHFSFVCLCMCVYVCVCVLGRFKGREDVVPPSVCSSHRCGEKRIYSRIS